jgi:hypothetical protein
LQDHLESLVVVSLDLEVRYPAVVLGCGNLAMPQEGIRGTPYITLERSLRTEYSLVQVDISTSEVGS